MQTLTFPADAETTELFNSGIIFKILIDVGIEPDDVTFTADEIFFEVDDAIISDLRDFIEDNPEEPGSKDIAAAIARLTESEEQDEEDNVDNEVEEEDLNEDEEDNFSLDENQQQLKDAIKDVIRGNTAAAEAKIKDVMSAKVGERYKDLKFRVNK